MKTTYSKIIEAQEGIRKLANKELPIKQAVELARLIKKISGEIEIYNESRMKILEKYGKYDPDKDMFSFDKENGSKAQTELNELGNIEVEIDCKKINISGDIQLDAAAVLACEEFIDFEE